MNIKAGTAYNAGTNIYYEVLGNPAHETLLLISGLGSQLVYWTDELCQVFVDRNFQVVRFDNRDVGLSSKTSGPAQPVSEILRSEGVNAPYSLSDMAADTIGILDALEIETAHMMGVSLGGMIAQTLAIEFPQRVRSLVSIMSAPRPRMAISDDDISAEAVSKSLTLDLNNPETYVDLQVEGYRATSGPHFDEAYIRQILQCSFNRCYHPAGWSFQMAAARASGDRLSGLSRLTLPSLIIHGAADPLIPVSSGQATAAAIPNARLMIIEDMGHCLLAPHWALVADAVAELAKNARHLPLPTT